MEDINKLLITYREQARLNGALKMLDHLKGNLSVGVLAEALEYAENLEPINDKPM